MAFPSAIHFNNIDIRDQTPTVFQWDDYKVIAIVTCLILLLSVSSISKCSIIYYICVYAPSRPINRMMLIDQICQLITSTIIGCLTIMSFIRRTPIIEDIGSISCWFYWAAILIHNLSVILGGLGMAAFRFLCIKLVYTTVAQVWSLLKQILLAEGLTASIILALFMILGYQLDPNTPVVLCRGYGNDMREIILEYQGDAHHAGIITLIVILLGL